jgi:hypothetical protein
LCPNVKNQTPGWISSGIIHLAISARIGVSRQAKIEILSSNNGENGLLFTKKLTQP